MQEQAEERKRLQSIISEWIRAGRERNLRDRTLEEVEQAYRDHKPCKMEMISATLIPI